jgi:predicted nucleic acid-binding protein
MGEVRGQNQKASADDTQRDFSRMLAPPLIHEALRGVGAHRMTYWDALIRATARLNQIPAILSEDFQDGRFLEGVRFFNPFLRNLEL